MQTHARPPSRAVLISSSPARQPAGSDQISAAPLSFPHSLPRPAALAPAAPRCRRPSKEPEHAAYPLRAWMQALRQPGAIARGRGRLS